MMVKLSVRVKSRTIKKMPQLLSVRAKSRTIEMKTLKNLYVYILKCSDKTYYTGITNNPERRLIQHQKGLKKDSYTFSRLPVELVFCELFTDFNLAIEWEKKIKNWSRVKKEALITQNWDKLKENAECRNDSSHKNTYRYTKN